MEVITICLFYRVYTPSCAFSDSDGLALGLINSTGVEAETII